MVEDLKTNQARHHESAFSDPPVTSQLKPSLGENNGLVLGFDQHHNVVRL